MKPQTTFFLLSLFCSVLTLDEWMSVEIFQDGSCEKQSYEYNAYQLDVCFFDGNTAQNNFPYRIYECSNNQGRSSICSNLNCSVCISDTSYENNSCSVLGDGRSVFLQCLASQPPSGDILQGLVVVQFAYLNSSCSGSPYQFLEIVTSPNSTSSCDKGDKLECSGGKVKAQKCVDDECSTGCVTNHAYEGCQPDGDGNSYTYTCYNNAGTNAGSNVTYSGAFVHAPVALALVVLFALVL